MGPQGLSSGVIIQTETESMERYKREQRPPGFGERFFGTALRSANKRRPASVYLLFAILLVVLLGVQIVYVWDNPKQFALFLSLNFLFFFVVMFRAIVDFFEILRSHFREQENLFRNTLGEKEFVARLGKRVSDSHKY